MKEKLVCIWRKYSLLTMISFYFSVIGAQADSIQTINIKIDSLSKLYSVSTLKDTSLYLVLIDSLLNQSRRQSVSKEHQQALKTNVLADQICLSKIGKFHPTYGSICFNYGKILVDKGDYQDAKKWYLESLNIRENTIGRMHGDYANSLNNLGRISSIEGDLIQAEKYFQESCDIRENVLGKSHPDYANSLENLGITNKNLSRYDKAEQIYLEVKSIRENTVGKEHFLYEIY